MFYQRFRLDEYGKAGSQDLPWAENYYLKCSGWDGVYDVANGEHIAPPSFWTNAFNWQRIYWTWIHVFPGPPVVHMILEQSKYFSESEQGWWWYITARLTSDPSGQRLTWGQLGPWAKPSLVSTFPIIFDNIAAPHGNVEPLIVRPVPWVDLPPP